MIEPHQWLVEHAAAFGYRPEYVGPASVDLCLHPSMRIATCCPGPMSPPKTRWWNTTLGEGESFTFKPQHFYLCSTVEAITVPPTHAAIVQMRSSLARKGLGHRMAGYVDPGFHGQITLELEATVDVPVTQGERIVQLVYIRLTEATHQPYRGRYLGQQGPTPAYEAQP